MKKTLKLAVLLVAFCVFAVSASAFSVAGKGAPDAVGGIFSVDVLAAAGGELAGSFTFSATGARFESISYGTGIIGQEHEGKVAVISLGIGAGDVIATLNFVTEASSFSVSVTGVDEFAGLSGTASDSIPEIAAPPPPPPPPPAQPPAQPPAVEVDETVKAGVGLAIVPVMVAAVATVVSRKRK